MRSVEADGASAGWALVALSFMYGVFHAAGPGHGKVVISTYILTQESQLRRGLILSFIASLAQGVTAVIAVLATVGLLRLSMSQAQDTAKGLETLSYGLIALVGVFLVASRTRRLWSRHAQPRGERQDVQQQFAVSQQNHGSACGDGHGHAHGPSRCDLDAPLSWHGIAGVIASIGLRPCSGAILVLLVAYSLSLVFAGIAAVAAMSIGTAITVSLLAVLSVYARKASLQLAAYLPDHRTRFATVVDVAGLIGGSLILLAGALLFHSSWTAPAHPLR